MDEHDFTEKDVEISDLKRNIEKHYEIPWLKGQSSAIKSICIGHNCELAKKDIRDILEECGVDSDIKITESKCTYRLRKED